MTWNQLVRQVAHGTILPPHWTKRHLPKKTLSKALYALFEHIAAESMHGRRTVVPEFGVLEEEFHTSVVRTSKAFRPWKQDLRQRHDQKQHRKLW